MDWLKGKSGKAYDLENPELENQENNNIELEKKDVLAIILSAFLVFAPIFLILIIIIIIALRLIS